MKAYLHHKSWESIKEELKQVDTVIVPLGSLEAHGPHCPVGCCYLLAEVASRDVGEKTGISVTPVIPFGVADAYRNYPGTIIISSKRLYQYVEEVCQSLIRSGFNKIVFFSAHGGGNLPVLRELSINLRERYGVLCVVLHLWGVVQQLVPPDFWGPDLTMGHGGEPVTSVMLHLHPELVDMSKAGFRPLRQPMPGLDTASYDVHKFRDASVSIPLLLEEVTDLGGMADPTRASKDKGERLYKLLLDYLIAFMENFRELDPKLP